MLLWKREVLLKRWIEKGNFKRRFSTTDPSNVDEHLKDLSKRGQIKNAISLLEHLTRYDIYVSQGTYVCMLQDCIYFKAFPEAKQIHATITKNNTILNTSLGNTLITMYIKCGDLIGARLVFDTTQTKNVFTWTLMIGCYSKFGQLEKAYMLFCRMISEDDIKPNKYTFLAVIKACCTLEQCKKLHTCIKKFGLEFDNFMRSSLIEMYARCGNLNLAQSVFNKVSDHDVITWNSMISVFVQHGQNWLALRLFSQLQNEGLEPDEATFICALKACTAVGSLQQGKVIHCYIKETNNKFSVAVENALIDMYAKSNDLENAAGVFLEISEPNVISWTSMIVAWTQFGFLREALEYFWEMQNHGVIPDDVTYISVLKTCANLAALEQCKGVHSCIVRFGHKSCTFIENTLIDMYSKCGSLDSAYYVFENMNKRDLVSWSAMISGFALHGSAIKALHLVKQMQMIELELDHVALVGILSACSHAGLLNEGMYYFKRAMDITPTSEHCACLVDMLTRTGRLEEAVAFIHASNNSCNLNIWTAVLSACKNFGEVELARQAAEYVLHITPESNVAFVLLANVYAEVGNWDERSRVRKLMEDRWTGKDSAVLDGL